MLEQRTENVERDPHLGRDPNHRHLCAAVDFTDCVRSKRYCYQHRTYILVTCTLLTKHHAMKAYLGVEVYLHAFLISALDGNNRSASRTGRFIPRERAPVTHWIGGWVGPRAGLDAVVKRKITSLFRELTPQSSSP
jgi:hypothetical protein